MINLRLAMFLAGLCCTVLCEERPECKTLEACARTNGKNIHISNALQVDPKDVTVEMQNKAYNDLCQCKDVLPHCTPSFRQCFDGSFDTVKDEDLGKAMELTCSNKPKYMAVSNCGLKYTKLGPESFYREYMASKKCRTIQAEFNKARNNSKGSNKYCSLLSEWIDCYPMARELKTCMVPFLAFLHEKGVAVECYSFYQSLSSAGEVPVVSIFIYAFVSVVAVMFWK